jgi:hypothetical protein
MSILGYSKQLKSLLSLIQECDFPVPDDPYFSGHDDYFSGHDDYFSGHDDPYFSGHDEYCKLLGQCLAVL